MIPYVRLFIPEISLEKKRTLVRELTQSLMNALHLPAAAADWCTIHILPLKSENVAVAGVLLADRGEPSYLIEITDRTLTIESREAIVHELKPSLMRNLGLRADQSYFLNFKFTVCEPRDFAIGGQFLNEYHERQAIALPVDFS